MKCLKTKNVKLVLYSIVRSIGDVTAITYEYSSKNYTVINENTFSSDENQKSIAIMKTLSKIKRFLNDGENIRIIFKTNQENNIIFEAFKKDGYYYISNPDLLIKYIIFELINESFRLNYSIISKRDGNCIRKAKQPLTMGYSRNSLLYDLVLDKSFAPDISNIFATVMTWYSCNGNCYIQFETERDLINLEIE